MQAHWGMIFAELYYYATSLLYSKTNAAQLGVFVQKEINHTGFNVHRLLADACLDLLIHSVVLVHVRSSIVLSC